MSLVEGLRAFCLRYGLDRTYIVGFSGGLDSHVLLSLCSELRDTPLKLRVIHINHGLSSNADVWSRHCAAICNAYQFNYRERIIQLERKAGESLEEAARKARYAALAEYLEKGDILLTAHHQDDQAETVLLQLLRGAGTKGLAGMPMMKPFAQGFHGRPLLSFPRLLLERYAKEKQLHWIEDESNRNVKLTRNFIRHDILPLLEIRWPSVTRTISRSALHCAEAGMLLEEFALEQLKNIKGTHAHTLSVVKLLSLRVEQQRLMIRTWIHQLGFSLPSTKKLETIQQNVLTAAPDRMPCVQWQETEVRRYRDDLYIMKGLDAPIIEHTYDWDSAKPLLLQDIGLLQTNVSGGEGIKQVIVRTRLGGEMLDLPHRGSHALKNLFQEWGVPPWQRSRIPLVFVAEKLIGVVGYYLAEGYAWLEPL